ncbi:MAG: metal ABC transporter permease [Acidimicrobiia bacterium]|nr:metal ABC transporter permease [Acidimicrobiia bacterium]
MLGGALAAVSGSVIGTWVVIRGMSFLGDALIHGVIPGIALAILLEFNVFIGAAIAAAVMIGGINLVHRQTVFSDDTGSGLWYVGMLGLGVIFISRTASYQGGIAAILFGDTLGVKSSDIQVLALVAFLVILTSLLLYRPFLVLSFNETKAGLLGLRPSITNASLLALVTLTIVGSYQTVGTMLAFGLMVGPPATAALLVRRVPAMMVTSVIIGIASVASGLIISYHADTSGSATMAVVPVVLFFIVMAITSLRQRALQTA